MRVEESKGAAKLVGAVERADAAASLEAAGRSGARNACAWWRSATRVDARMQPASAACTLSSIPIGVR